MATNMTKESVRVVSLDKKRHVRGKKTLGRFGSTRQVDGHCVSLTAPDSYEAGQYLRLRYAVEAKRPAGRGMVVGVCSPAAGDGKSLTALNLAGALSQRRGSRVLLVDTDLRRRSEVIRNLVPISGALAPGLSELLLGARQNYVGDVVRRIEHTNICVVLTGSLPIAPYEAFTSERFSLFMERVRNDFDYVVIDAPPVVAVPDCKLLAKCMDSLVMVVSANQTPRILLAQALEILGPEKILGLVFNKSDQLPPRYYRYYGKYGYSARARVEDIGRIVALPGNYRDAAEKDGGNDSTMRF